jgi:hypothetical protein
MSEQETNNNEEQRPQMSNQEIVAMRKRMKQFYSEEISYLKLQEDYERLLANIEEHKVRRMTMIIRGAQMYAAGEAAEKEAIQKEFEEETDKAPEPEFKPEVKPE